MPSHPEHRPNCCGYPDGVEHGTFDPDDPRDRPFLPQFTKCHRCNRTVPVVKERLAQHWEDGRWSRLILKFLRTRPFLCRNSGQTKQWNDEQRETDSHVY